jgi:drug/metabolite transporter (DMT)-like permease
LLIAALRLTIATAVVAPFALARNRRELASLRRDDWFLAAASGVFLALHFATWISSLEYTSVAASVVLVSTGPIWVALIAPAVLGERMGMAGIIGLLLAILGGMLIASGDACSWNQGLRCKDLEQVLRGRALWGNGLALAGAWAVSGYLIIGRRLRSTLSLMPYITLVYGAGAICLLAVTLLSGSFTLKLPAAAWGWIALLAIVPQLIGHSTYNWALRYLPAAFVAVATLGEPVGSAILAYFILDERPGLIILVGGGLIMLGIYLAARGAARLQTGARPANQGAVPQD